MAHRTLRVSFKTHLPSLTQLRQRETNLRIRRGAYLVDMAKVEALDTMGENRKAVELLALALGKA